MAGRLRQACSRHGYLLRLGQQGRLRPQDGEADHVGIVQKVEDGIIYTVEGNSGNLCRVNRYPIGHYEILGYGVLCRNKENGVTPSGGTIFLKSNATNELTIMC